MRPTLLALGSINADFQMRIDQDFGEIETARAHDALRLSGGKAANIAYLARKLGHPAQLLGRVGNDELATQALGGPKKLGADLSGVFRAETTGTAISLIVVPKDGYKRILLAENANLDWSQADLQALPEHLEDAPPGSVLVVNFETDPRAVAIAIETARKRGFRVVIDPSFPDRADRELLHQADAMTPNAEEAAQLTGTDKGQDEKAFERLSGFGPPIVCLKRGNGGCLLWAGGRRRELHSAGSAVVDSTGAGDAFTGAFAIALLEGRSAEEAAMYGVAASDLAVRVYGSQPSYPDRAQLEAQLAQVRAKNRP